MAKLKQYGIISINKINDKGCRFLCILTKYQYIFKKKVQQSSDTDTKGSYYFPSVNSTFKVLAMAILVSLQVLKYVLTTAITYLTH